MSDDRRSMTEHVVSCSPNQHGHCVTCSDEALPAQVLSIDQETGLALVTVQDSTAEVDITLLDLVMPGDMLLVHGGVALERLKEPSDDRPGRL